MSGIARLLRDQPSYVGTLTAALVGLAVAVGVDPTLGAAVGSLLTVLAGLWIHASVYAPATVASKIQEAVTLTASQLTPELVGAAGTVSPEAATLVADVAHQVLGDGPGVGAAAR